MNNERLKASDARKSRIESRWLFLVQKDDGDWSSATTYETPGKADEWRAFYLNAGKHVTDIKKIDFELPI